MAPGGATAMPIRADVDRRFARFELGETAEAEKVVASTNERVQAASDLMAGLRNEGVLSAESVACP